MLDIEFIDLDEEMDFDDLMKISPENLRKMVPKFGPANKILNARKGLQVQNASKIDKNGNYCSSDEEDEAAAEPEVLFIKNMQAQSSEFAVLPVLTIHTRIVSRKCWKFCLKVLYRPP